MAFFDCQSGGTITDSLYWVRYTQENSAASYSQCDYDLLNCRKCTVNITQFKVTNGNPTITIKGDNTTLYTLTKGQTGSYTINNPSQYSQLSITLSYPVGAYNITVHGNVVRTF